MFHLPDGHHFSRPIHPKRHGLTTPIVTGTLRDMPNRSSKQPKRPRDVNQLAKSIVDEAVGGVQALALRADGKNPAAVELGRLGGLKGGRARALTLTAKRRSQIAMKAAEARWSKENKKHGGK